MMTDAHEMSKWFLNFLTIITDRRAAPRPLPYGLKEVKVMNQNKEIPKYRTPKPSRAVRPILKKSPKHFVGQLTFGEDKGQGQCLGFASGHEKDTALLVTPKHPLADYRSVLG